MNLKTLFICCAIGLLVALPVFASVYEGSLCTGLNCPVEGTVIVAPTFSPVAGTYNATQSVTLAASGSSAICYTTNGSTPACNGAYACTTGTLYNSSAISITSTKTVKAISCYPNSNTSSVSSSTYTLVCATASVSNGTVSAYPTCAITCNSGYTLSGSTCVASGGGGGGGGYVAPTPTPEPEPEPEPEEEADVPVVGLDDEPLFDKPISEMTSSELLGAIAKIQAMIATLRAEIAKITGVPEPTDVPTACQNITFTRNLSLGATGTDVRCLQAILNMSADTRVALTGPGSSGNETTLFGPLTRAALAKFQAAKGISPAAGYFGPITRAYLESIGY
jgi:hypothetical protein